MYKHVPTQPAVDFETIFQIDGVSQQYQFPNGMTACEAELHLFSNYPMNVESTPDSTKLDFELASSLIQELVTLNPELSSLLTHVNSMQDAIDLYRGATSGFNIADIEYFFTTPIEEKRRANRQGHMKALTERTTFGCGCTPVGWGIHPKTAAKIHMKLDAKYGVYEIPETYHSDYHYSQFIDWPPVKMILQSFRTGEPALVTNIEHILKRRLAEQALNKS